MRFRRGRRSFSRRRRTSFRKRRGVRGMLRAAIARRIGRRM